MARVEVPIVVINSSTGLPVNGASVSLTKRSSGAAATWYPSETGGVASTAVVVTDANGRVNAWVARGAYNATISGTGITTYTESFDAAPAGDQGIDSPWLAAEVLPSGIVLPFGGSVNPAGWLFVDGSTVSRTTYSGLFAILGTTYGAGDGSTTFGLPDLKGRVPMGAGTGAGLTARARGDKAGEETHVLSIAEMPAHGHGVTDPGHEHRVSGFTGASHGVSGDGSLALYHAGGGGDATNVLEGVTPAATGISINSQGGGGGHNVVQPFLVLSYIIKT